MSQSAREGSRSTIIGAAALLFLAVAPQAAMAQGPAPLPASPQRALISSSSAELAAGLESGRLGAESCEIANGALACRCVHGAEWSADVAGDVVEGLRGDGFYAERSSQREANGVAFFVNGRWVTFDHLEVDAGVTVATSVRWLEGPHAALTCGSAPVFGREVARATSAKLRDGRWTVRGYHVAPWPVPLSRRAGRAAPGLLPPTVRAVPDRIEAEALGHLGFGLLAVAGGGLRAPATFGLGLATTDHEQHILRGLVAIEDGEASPVLIGGVGVGGLTHVRGTIEHPNSSGSLWELRRREQGGFFRDWRATRVGAAASGAAHSLQLSGEVVTEPGLPNDQWLGSLQYGTGFSTGPARWTADVEQRSDRLEATRHSILVDVGVAVPIGRPNAFWIEPSADLLANYGAVTVARGFDGSTTISALAQVEAGLALEGRGRKWRHRFAPIARAGGELFGVQQRQSREGAPPYPYTRPDRWRYAGLFLEHTIVAGPFTVELPMGVYVDALGDESIGTAMDTPVGFARASTRLGPARADVGVVCDGDCTTPGYTLGATVQPGRLAVGYRLSALERRQATMMFADTLFERGFSAVRLVQDGGPGVDEPAHHARLQWGSRRLRLGLDGIYERGGSGAGVGMDGAIVWPTLGWGLGLGAAWTPDTDDWAASTGFRLAL